MTDVIFVLTGLLCAASALLMVSRRNPVHAVVCLLPYFLGLTVLFLLLSAPFLAAMQVMVYGGAILVVFLFVIMLLSLRPEELRDDSSLPGQLLPACLVGLLAGLLIGFILAGLEPDGVWEQAFRAPAGGTAAGGAASEFGSLNSLSLPLFQRYIVPFELVSVLIVVAILGAVILGKKKLE